MSLRAAKTSETFLKATRGHPPAWTDVYTPPKLKASPGTPARWVEEGNQIVQKHFLDPVESAWRVQRETVD